LLDSSRMACALLETKENQKVELEFWSVKSQSVKSDAQFEVG